MRHVWPRVALALPVGIVLGAGVVGGLSREPIVIRGNGGIVLAPVPFWAAVCLGVGMVLALLLFAVRRVEDIPARAGPLLLVLWVLQFTGGAGIYRWPTETPPNSTWLTRSTALSSLWWGLACLALAVVGTVVWSRKRE